MVCIKFWGLVFGCMYKKAYNRKRVLILHMGHNTELLSYFDFYQHKELIVTFSLSAVFFKQDEATTFLQSVSIYQCTQL